MNLKLKRTPGIYLVGFMGAGKSTIGRALAGRLGWSFFDIDEEIERAEKAAIPEIFSSRGEAEFRRIESAAIRRHLSLIEQGRPAVMALGGGAFQSIENRQALEANGITVWLECPFDVVERRVARDPHRPLAADPTAFRALYDSRQSTYALAEIHVGSENDDPALAVDAILSHPLMR